MTTTKPPAERTPDTTEAVSRRTNRGWPAAVAVLTAAVLFLGAWVIYDLATQPALPGEVEQAIDEFILAWEEQDEAALRAMVTGDFWEVTHTYELGIGSLEGRTLLYGRSSMPIQGTVVAALRSEWQIERIGEPAVSGDGPWFVAVEENWTKCTPPEGTTGACAPVRFPGTGIYVVVEEDGSLKIAEHVWTGLIER